MKKGKPASPEWWGKAPPPAVDARQPIRSRVSTTGLRSPCTTHPLTGLGPVLLVQVLLGRQGSCRPTASFPGGAHAVDGGQAAKAGLRKENRLDTQNGSWFRPQYPHNGQCELASRSAARAQRAARLVYDDGSEGDAGQVRRRACRRRRRLRRQRRRRQQPVRLLGGDRFGDTFDVQL